jgi:AraC-like DNA-binding protein
VSKASYFVLVTQVPQQQLFGVVEFQSRSPRGDFVPNLRLSHAHPEHRDLDQRINGLASLGYHIGEAVGEWNATPASPHISDRAFGEIVAAAAAKVGLEVAASFELDWHSFHGMSPTALNGRLMKAIENRESLEETVLV